MAITAFTGGQGGNSSSPTISFGFTASAGDLIILAVGKDGTGTFTWPSPWVEMKDEAITGGVATVAYLIASGGETDVAPSSTSERWEWVGWRIPDGEWQGTTPPEINTLATGSSTTPNPGSITPSWGAENDNIFIAVAFRDDSAANTITAYPANYSTAQADKNNISSALNVGGAVRIVASGGSPEDPGSFTISASETWGAYTIAVRPAVPPTTVSGSFTADAFIKRAGITSSFTANAYIKKTITEQTRVVLLDTFTGPDFTQLVNHEPDIHPAGGATGWTSVGGDLELSSNEAIGFGSFGNSYDVGETEYDFEVDIRSSVNDIAEAVFRSDSDLTDGIAIRRTSLGGWQLVELVGGSDGDILLSGLGLTNGAMVNFRVVGNELFVDDESQGTFDSAIVGSHIGIRIAALNTFIGFDNVRVEAGGPNAFTLDAEISAAAQPGGSFTADAYIKRAGLSGSFTADAFIRRVGLTGSFTADAFVKGVGVAGSVTADAFIRRTFSGSVTADANIAATVTGLFTVDAYVKKTQSNSFTADAYITGITGGSFTADAFIKRVGISGSFTADAYLRATLAGSFTADAYIRRTFEQSFTADAFVRVTQSGSLTANAFVRRTFDSTFTADAYVSGLVTGSFTADAEIAPPEPGERLGSFTADAFILRTGLSGSFTADAFIARTASDNFVADAFIRRTFEQSFVADAFIRVLQTGSFVADAFLRCTFSGLFTADAHIAATVLSSFTLDAHIFNPNATQNITGSTSVSVMGRFGGTYASSWASGIRLCPVCGKRHTTASRGLSGTTTVSTGD
jgi:hypothetical protein